MLVVLFCFVGLLGGCAPQAEAADPGEIEKLQAQLQEKDKLLEAKEKELDTTKEELEACYSSGEPLIEEVSFEDASFIKLRETLKKFYPNAKICISTHGATKINYLRFTSLDDCKRFLKSDRSNMVPFYKYTPPYNYSDQVAFRLKARWSERGLPGGSLALLKGTRIIQKEEVILWIDLFIEKVGDEFLLYEIFPNTDEIIPVMEPNMETYFIDVTNEL